VNALDYTSFVPLSQKNRKRRKPTEMASSEISELIPAPSSAVFDLLHDYAR